MNTWKKELNPELMRIVSGGELSHDDKKAIFNTIYEAKKKGLDAGLHCFLAARASAGHDGRRNPVPDR